MYAPFRVQFQGQVLCKLQLVLLYKFIQRGRIISQLYHYDRNKIFMFSFLQVQEEPCPCPSLQNQEFVFRWYFINT